MALLNDECIDFGISPNGCISGLSLVEIDEYIGSIEREENAMKEMDNEIKAAHDTLKTKSTAAQTAFYVRKFKTFLTNKGLREDFENLESKTLLKSIQSWLINAKKHDGTTYTPQTYNCMKSAIHRHLLLVNGKGIIGNPDFEQLKLTLNACTD